MILVLAGCGPGQLDREEAQAVYTAMEGINSDVWAFLYDRSAPEDPADTGGGDTGATPPPDTGWETGFAEGAAKQVQWHTYADGSGSFEGTFSGLGSWTGEVALVGTYTPTLLTFEEWSQLWDMQVGWTDVEFGDLRLEADFGWDVGAWYDDGAFVYESRVSGDVLSRGGALGEGRAEYLTTVRYTGGRYLVATEGTVGGHDVSVEYDASAFAL